MNNVIFQTIVYVDGIDLRQKLVDKGLAKKTPDFQVTKFKLLTKPTSTVSLGNHEESTDNKNVQTSTVTKLPDEHHESENDEIRK